MVLDTMDLNYVKNCRAIPRAVGFFNLTASTAVSDNTISHKGVSKVKHDNFCCPKSQVERPDFTIEVSRSSILEISGAVGFFNLTANTAVSDNTFSHKGVSKG